MAARLKSVSFDCLRANLSFIIDNLRTGEVLNRLYGRTVLTQREYEKLERVLDNEGSSSAAEHLICDVLMKRPDEDKFKQFMDALRDSEHNTVADFLEQDYEFRKKNPQPERKIGAPDLTKPRGDEDLTDLYFSKMAEYIGNEWQTLGYNLGLTHSRIQRLMADERSAKSRTTTMLCEWAYDSALSDDDKRLKLREALTQCRRRDLADLYYPIKKREKPVGPRPPGYSSDGKKVQNPSDSGSIRMEFTESASKDQKLAAEGESHEYKKHMKEREYQKEKSARTAGSAGNQASSETARPSAAPNNTELGGGKQDKANQSEPRMQTSDTASPMDRGDSISIENSGPEPMETGQEAPPSFGSAQHPVQETGDREDFPLKRQPPSFNLSGPDDGSIQTAQCTSGRDWHYGDTAKPAAAASCGNTQGDQVPAVEPMNGPPDLRLKEDFLQMDHSDDNLLLGKGTFGVVYKGKYCSTDVVVKMMRLKFNNNTIVSSRFEETFVQQIQQMASVQNRYLVNVVGYCKDMSNTKETIYRIIHTLVNGDNLEEILFGNFQEVVMIKQKLSIAVKLDLAYQMCLAFLHLHNAYSAPILHCNFNLVNVIVEHCNGVFTAKISDFGFFRIKQAYETSQKQLDPSYIGRITYNTSIYVAPELANNTNTSHSTHSDVYSLAVSILVLFKETKDLQVLKAAADTEAPGNQLKHLFEMFSKCLSRDPNQRMNVSDIVREINEIR